MRSLVPESVTEPTRVRIANSTSRFPPLHPASVAARFGGGSSFRLIMPKAYRIFFFEHGLKRSSDVVYGENDADVRRKVRELNWSNDVEIWDGPRPVAIIAANEKQ